MGVRLRAMMFFTLTAWAVLWAGTSALVVAVTGSTWAEAWAYSLGGLVTLTLLAAIGVVVAGRDDYHG